MTGKQVSELPQLRSRMLLAICAAASGAGWGLYAAQESWRQADVWEILWVVLISAAAPIAIFLWRRPGAAFPLLIAASVLAPPVVAALWVVLFLRGMHRPGRSTLIAMGAGMAAVVSQTLLYPTLVEGGLHLEVLARQLVFGVQMVAFSTASGWMIGAHLRSQIRLRALILEAARTEAALSDKARRNERMHLSRLIHDGLGSRSAVLNIYSQIVLTAETSAEERANAATLLASESHVLAQEIRRTIDDLAARRLEHSVGPLEDAISAFSTAFNQLGSRLVTSIHADLTNLSDSDYDLVVVFARETLTNAIKHGCIGDVELTTVTDDSERIVITTRNGLANRPSHSSAGSSGLGLPHLRAEAREAGAEFFTEVGDVSFTARLTLRPRTYLQTLKASDEPQHEDIS